MEFDEKKAERRELIYAMLMSVVEYPSAEWLFAEPKGADDEREDIRRDKQWKADSGN